MIPSVRKKLFILVVLSAAALAGETIGEPSSVTVDVDSTGVFTIQSGTWIYSGNLNGSVISIAGPVTGSDSNAVSTNGLFDEITVNYSDPDGNPWRMQLRAYRSLPSATISFSPLTETANTGPYAVLNQFPITPHHFSNAGWNRAFGLVGWMNTDSAWLFYDDQYNASIMSPLSRPISERQTWTDDHSTYGVINLEIDSSNAILHAGDIYSYIFTFGQGIGSTFNSWGSAFRNIVGRPATSNQADLSLLVPMLSTDSGATYYYTFEQSLGYEGTLQAAKASAQAAGIQLGLTHFDSWWYLKGGNCKDVRNSSGAAWNNTQHGVWQFVTDPAIFPHINSADPQAGFVQTLGPGMAHGRWVDDCSPYRQPLVDQTGQPRAVQPVSGNVIIDPHIWRNISDGLKKSGIRIYEQDFLSGPAVAANTFDDEKFLTAMAAAMAKNGISLQFCMPLARHLLEAIQLPQVHTMRASGDRFEWKHWQQELYGSVILNAGGLWPTVDNFHTSETRNLLLAVLSAGPLALADPIGSFVPIPQAIRSDGLILKPDVSAVPSDASFVAEAYAMESYWGVNGTSATNAGNRSPLVLPPLVSHTYSNFGSSTVGYVFAYSRDENNLQTATFAPQDFGFTSDVYVYDYFNHAGWRQAAGDAIVKPVDSQGSYYVVAPVGLSGIAFLGDLSRFVSASSQRVISLSDTGQITSALEFTPGESVTISMFASATPLVSVNGGSVTTPSLDSSTGLYSVTVTPSTGSNNQATLLIQSGH
jgi:hypothetical protein